MTFRIQGVKLQNAALYGLLPVSQAHSCLEWSGSFCRNYAQICYFIFARTLREDLKRSSVLSSPTAVRDYIRLLLIGKEHEMFLVLLLDAQNRVIDVEELFRGTLTQTSVYPREVVKCALRHNAAAVIFAHNHPSGVAEPSHSDEVLTQALKQALALVDVKVLDHFIAAGTASISFAERGLI